MISNSLPTISYSRPNRTYEGLWKLLREQKKIVIEVVDPIFVARIKRMVSKEKYADKKFRRQQPNKYIGFSWDKAANTLTLRLLDTYPQSIIYKL